MASSYENNPFVNSLNILSDGLLKDYLIGNVLRMDSQNSLLKNSCNGYIGVYYDGYPLGLGKLSGSTVKNHLPKGLRHYS